MTIVVLEEIKRSERCPLCYLWVKSEEHFMEYLLTNDVNMSPEFRERVQAAKGLIFRNSENLNLDLPTV